MKLNLPTLIAVSALIGGFFTLSANADDVGTSYLLDREAQSIMSDDKPANERRVPAFVRIDHGLSVHSQAGRNEAMARHDEMSTRVLAFHTVLGRPAKLVAGHGLAPNLHKIAKP